MMCLSRMTLVLLVLLSFSVWADYQLGLEAYKGGNYESAYAEWIKVAASAPEEVNPAILAESQYAIGMLYWLGQGVPQDTAAAANWLRRAAEMNHPGAQAKLGYLYSTGQGVPKSEYEAFKWLLMAARQGDPEAQYNVGVYYREGLAVKANGTEALKWFRKAAANGDAQSALIVKQYEAGVPVANPAGRSQIEDDNSSAEEDLHASAFLPNSAPAVLEDGRSPPADDDLRANALQQSPPSWFTEDWIRQRDPEHYTIQVIVLLEPDKLYDFIGRHPDWSPLAIYQQQWQGETLWVLVQGDYTGVALARVAAQKFPAGLEQRKNLWIRRFAMVQEQLP